MPYIDIKRREEIYPHIQKFWSDCPIDNPGDLNFVITTLLEHYRGGKYRYALFNEIIGVLTCIIQEYYRRMVAVYEDEKIEQNGDVFYLP